MDAKTHRRGGVGRDPVAVAMQRDPTVGAAPRDGLVEAAAGRLLEGHPIATARFKSRGQGVVDDLLADARRADGDDFGGIVPRHRCRVGDTPGKFKRSTARARPGGELSRSVAHNAADGVKAAHFFAAAPSLQLLFCGEVFVRQVHFFGQGLHPGLTDHSRAAALQRQRHQRRVSDAQGVDDARKRLPRPIHDGGGDPDFAVTLNRRAHSRIELGVILQSSQRTDDDLAERTACQFAQKHWPANCLQAARAARAPFRARAACDGASPCTIITGPWDVPESSCMILISVLVPHRRDPGQLPGSEFPAGRSCPRISSPHAKRQGGQVVQPSEGSRGCRFDRWAAFHGSKFGDGV